MKRLEFVNEDRLLVVHFCLFINVSSINEKLGITVDDFVENYKLWGVTNGKLLIIADMIHPSEGLEMIVSDVLLPNGFERGPDWEYTYERDTYNAPYDSGYLFKEIPELEDLDWVDSALLEDGNWVWHKALIEF